MCIRIYLCMYVRMHVLCMCIIYVMQHQLVISPHCQIIRYTQILSLSFSLFFSSLISLSLFLSFLLLFLSLSLSHFFPFFTKQKSPFVRNILTTVISMAYIVSSLLACKKFFLLQNFFQWSHSSSIYIYIYFTVIVYIKQKE